MSIGQEFDGPIRPSSLPVCVIRSNEIGPAGEIGGGQRPTDEGLVRMEHLPAAGKLVLVAPHTQDVPGLLDRDGFHALQEIVGNLRPSVGVAIAFPRSGHREQVGL